MSNKTPSPLPAESSPNSISPPEPQGGGSASLCTCDRGPVVRVWSEKCDEEFYFYRRCPECEKDKALAFSISTLQELNRYMIVSLTEEGRIYKRELETQEILKQSSKYINRRSNK